MEWLCEARPDTKVTTVLFDFDGTISTLRCGWEEVMEPLMIEFIDESNGQDEAIREMVKKYIDESTGIQTIFQMKWLADQVLLRNPNACPDPWEYKAEYNKRLMLSVMERRQQLKEKKVNPEDFMVAGSHEVLEMLSNNGVSLYIASGTDDKDVKQEVEVLGLTKYFNEIKGAPEGREDCSKEAVIRDLIIEKGTDSNKLAVVGDGKVEIAIGLENGARTLGVASDEVRLSGVNPVKRERLLKAGAHAIVGDFLDISSLNEFFFGKVDT